MNEIESKEFEVKKTLEKDRENIGSLEELMSYLENVKENYNCGYGEAPRAIAQASLATAWYLAKEFGITGFQAGFVMWDFIRGWMYQNNECVTFQICDHLHSCCFPFRSSFFNADQDFIIHRYNCVNSSLYCS